MSSLYSKCERGSKRLCLTSDGPALFAVLDGRYDRPDSDRKPEAVDHAPEGQEFSLEQGRIGEEAVVTVVRGDVQ